MSYDRQQPQHHQGEYDKGKEHCDPPPPPPPPCPDPCDDKPPWGPPEIRKECCQHHPCCPDGEQHCCTWESVEDPCVKAASADCGLAWTTITCKCESSNKDCDCEEWDCSCYPQGQCVPCYPCEGLIPPPEPPDGPGGCNEPGRDECTSEELQKQLDALNQCITSQEDAKKKIDADIEARKKRAKDLGDLIKLFPGLLTKYKDERHKLVCRENCLKGFYRDMSTHFKNFPNADAITKFINDLLCKVAQVQCCQKSLEGKLTKFTKLNWEQQQAQKEKDKADEALKAIQDYPGWLDKQFKELETLKEQIAVAVNNVDPQQHKIGFYLFYWKFVPKLCRCFPYPFCCNKDGGYEQGSEQQQQQGQQGQQQQAYNQSGQQQKSQQQQGQQQGTQQGGQEKPSDHLGCKPGDWHPSAIKEKDLRALVCCAWDYARQKKQELQEATDRVADVTRNLANITAKAKADADSLDDRIKSGLNKVSQAAPTSS